MVRILPNMTVSVETFISSVNLFVNARKLKINMCALSAILVISEKVPLSSILT